jgi:protein SCO1/2
MRALLAWAVVGLAVLGGACVRAAPPTFHGLPVQAALPLDVTLLDHDGRPFSLQRLTGTVTFLTFGYTLCPDICPLTLVGLREARTLLGADAAQVRILFVTTDPERDTPERLRWYVSIFHPEFIGLTGDSLSLARVYQAFNIYPVPYAAAGATEDARIGHATAIYLVDRHGTIRFSYPWGVLPADLASDARVVLVER